MAQIDGKLGFKVEDQPSNTLCTICMDVLAKAEISVPGIAAQVRNSGFEYCDFKLTFSISLRAYLNRMLLITQAEQALSKDFSRHMNKSQLRGGKIDFKEVFKWVVSPILARELAVQANLDGSFHINCQFMRAATELPIVAAGAQEECKEVSEEAMLL